MKRSLTIALLGILLLGAKPVSAAPAISLNQTDPHLFDVVTFTITGLEPKYDCTGHVKCARVALDCYQGSLYVSAETGDLLQARGEYGSYTELIGFGVGGYWPLPPGTLDGSGLDCTATLFRFYSTGHVDQVRIILATLTFHASE